KLPTGNVFAIRLASRNTETVRSRVISWFLIHNLSEGKEMSQTRREAIQFLGSLGLLGVGGVPVAAIDAAMNGARAQVVPGGVVPPLQAWLPNWPDMIEIMRQVSKTWRELGVTIELQQGDISVWRTQIAGQHKMPHFAAISWGGTPDRLDPEFFLSIMTSAHGKPGGMNYGGFRNAEYDKLVAEQNEEFDNAKRQSLVRKAQAVLAEQDADYVLFFRDVICAYNSERWDNVVPTLGSGLTHYVPWAFMQMKPKTRRDIVRATVPYDYDTLNPFAALGVSNQTIVRWIYPTLTYR